MSEVVDSIVADLILRGVDKYEAGFLRATKAHENFTRSFPKVSGFAAMGSIDADAQKYVDRHTKAGAAVVANETATTEKVKRTRKARTDAAVANDEVEVRSAKRAADARIAEAERVAAREARLDASAKRRTIQTTGAGLQPATGGRIGATVPNEAHGQTSIPMGVLNGAGDAALVADAVAEAEINHLALDRFDLTAKAAVAEGAVKRELKDQIEYLRRIDVYKKAGLSDDAAIARAEAEILSIEKLRAANDEKKSLSNVARFGEAAGIGRTGGSGAAVAGLAVAAAATAVAAAVEHSVDFARTLNEQSKALGIATTKLQVYSAAAQEAGVTEEQFRSALGQAASNLGRAQEGAVQQGKIFRALGVDIGNAKDGYKSLGDILPTIIDRLSSIAEPANRAAVETALFGEEGRRLDGMLSGGIEKINSLSDAMDKAGSTLSPADIQSLTEAGVALSKLKNVLEVDIARIVAGNADAIKGLASAFSFLADHIGGAIQQMVAWGKAASNSFGGWGKYSALPVVGGAMGFGSGLVGGMQQNPTVAGKGSLRIMAAQQASEIGDYVQQGKVDRGLLAKLNAPKPPKGRKGPKGKTPEQIEAEYQDELERQRSRELSAVASLTEDAEDRAKASLAALDAEHAAFVKRLANDKGLTAAQKKALSAEEARADAAARAKIDDERLDQKQEEAFRLADADLAAQEEALQAKIGLARTAKERLALELQLLDLEEKREMARLNHQVDVGTPQQQAEALAAQQRLPAQAEAKRNAAKKADQGPLAAYLDSLPKTANDIEEAFEKAAVNGIERMNDGLATTLEKLTGIHGAAGEFLTDLIKIGLQILENNAASAAGGGGFGGILSAIGKAAGSIFGGGNGIGGIDASSGDLIVTGHRASGGNVVGGGNYLVGEHGPEIVHMGSSGQVYPNGKLANLSAGGGTTIIAPQHFDLSGVVMTRDLVVQMDARNRAYANAVGQAAAQGAVKAGPGYQARVATLGN